jgi:hypothetical protein
VTTTTMMTPHIHISSPFRFRGASRQNLVELTIQLSRTRRPPYVPAGTHAVHPCAHNRPQGQPRDVEGLGLRGLEGSVIRRRRRLRGSHTALASEQSAQPASSTKKNEADECRPVADPGWEELWRVSGENGGSLMTEVRIRPG